MSASYHFVKTVSTRPTLPYCNSALAGLPVSTLARLQRVQNAAARLVLNLDRRSHITPALHQFTAGSQDFKYRINFTIATLMHHILHDRCQSYLADLVAFNTTNSQRRQLTSSQTGAAVVKRTRMQFGKSAFSACGPSIWNSLPPAVRKLIVILCLDEL